MNLRKDHCRTCTAERPENPFQRRGSAGLLARRPLRPGSPLPGVQTYTGACCAKESERKSALPPPRNRCARGCVVVFDKSKRLSATDISALASMKNVAKCDTWCELQNPVNHRVFERKLRPKPSGRGHACLGVTRRCPPHASLGSVGGGRTMASRASPRAVGTNAGSSATNATTIGGRRTSVASCALSSRSERPATLAALASAELSTRPQVRRGYPLNLSISISGGKETYEDSPSNGERTGNSPA